eukprot:CAMPEP_0177164620 /NCGR_PEP_ID=MMETSP0367-20130122/7046_1 /TAXON_ID=447022 ORGANISM="Scrippsiella hangoei-like, Strain SHHI-4" /NCGR_SAMPLE_ID=MMETSP0367 /ASSEMBLY_ACC=CAM_ASM_000362 /LENGTH=267 /DNA_ID=CAMNT_0018610531 /DNA_START=63 /DNA_END=864 /DNA_ORIENTATION=+
MAATCRTIDLLIMGMPLPYLRQLAGLPALKDVCHAFDDDDDDISVSTKSAKSDSQGPTDLLDGTSSHGAQPSYYAGSADFAGSLDCSRSVPSSLFASERSVCTEATSFDEVLPKGFAEPPGLQLMFNQVPLTRSALLAAAFAPALKAQVAVPPLPPPVPPAPACERVVGRDPVYIEPARKGMLSLGDDFSEEDRQAPSATPSAAICPASSSRSPSWVARTGAGAPAATCASGPRVARTPLRSVRLTVCVCDMKALTCDFDCLPGCRR